MGRSRPQATPEANPERAADAARPTPQVEQLAQSPEQTGAVAAAIAVAGIQGAAALPLVAQALLTAQAAEVGLAGAQQSAEVALLVAGLAVAPPIDRIVAAPSTAPEQTQDLPQRREAYASGARRSGYARELLNRARYARAATSRGIHAYAQGREEFAAWRSRERVWHKAHTEAVAVRQEARGRNDAAAARWGRILGWYGERDRSTTLDCLEMIGKNFDVAQPPLIGLPGTVHRFCRCTAGAPHPNAEVVY